MEINIEALAAAQRICADACDAHQDEGKPEADDFDEVERMLCEALDQAEEKLMAARADLAQWNDLQLQRGGAVVRVDGQGRLVIERGLVRPEDRGTVPGPDGEE